ncbi:MAG: AraC family transcriptional regulator [Bacteroidetes bacterium]|nr:AraC family transcriptional regulator [Bacteroidota bacterium]
MNDLKIIYKERINWVIEYVNNNLNESLSLDDLAEIACFSSYHFHRIFMAVTGETVNNFTNRLRAEKAARLLKFSKNSVSNIALDCGLSSPSAFSRSFKQYFGLTPNEFKKNGNIKNSKICKELYQINQHIAPMTIEELKSRFPVEIREFPERRIAFIRVINSYQEGVVLKAYERIINWAKELEIYESETIFGMSLDDPMVTPQDKYRYEVCITIPESLKVNHTDISTMKMPKSKYATTIISGNIDVIATAFCYLFNYWLVNSSYEPEHLHALEIFLDKNNVCNWEHFDLELCIPIKTLQKYNINN